MPVPSISVIVPLFNKARTACEAIESVLGQDIHAELIVVDDGSTDGSLTAIERYRGRARILQQPNAGPAAARNHGVRVSCGELVTFLDADDVLLPGALRAHLDMRSSVSNDAATIGSFRYRGADGVNVEHDVPARLTPGGASRVVVNTFSGRLALNVPPSAVMMSRPAYDRIGGFDEQLRSWEISDFMIRLLCTTPNVVACSRQVTEIRDTPDSASKRTHSKVAYIVRYLHKLASTLQTIPNAERMHLLGPAESLVRDVWRAGDVASFRAIMNELYPYFVEQRGASRLVRASRLPAPLLHLIRAVQG